MVSGNGYGNTHQMHMRTHQSNTYENTLNTKYGYVNTHQRMPTYIKDAKNVTQTHNHSALAAYIKAVVWHHYIKEIQTHNHIKAEAWHHYIKEIWWCFGMH